MVDENIKNKNQILGLIATNLALIVIAVFVSITMFFEGLEAYQLAEMGKVFFSVVGFVVMISFLNNAYSRIYSSVKDLRNAKKIKVNL